MPRQLRKATHSQLHRTNRQLLLHTVYAGNAASRADLAHDTGLTKPTVSELVQELIDQGYLIEIGLGSSTDEGGKRPRLLQYVPNARQVIGLTLTARCVDGVLANLDGYVAAQHQIELSDIDLAETDGSIKIMTAVFETINSLIAQLTAPLLCICVGVPGVVEMASGTVRIAPDWNWRDFPLRTVLSERYTAPIYIANSTELAAIGQYAFGSPPAPSTLVTVLVEDQIGVGIALDSGAYHSGGEIGHLRIGPNAAGGQWPDHDPAIDISDISLMPDQLGAHLSWERVRTQLTWAIADIYPTEKLMYLHLRQAVADSYPKAVALQAELAGYLAPVFAWAISLIQPDHLSLIGAIADLGKPFLEQVVTLAEVLADPLRIRAVTFSLDSASDWSAVGAVAYALQQELGLI